MSRKNEYKPVGSPNKKKMTRKQKAYADYKLANPKASNTESAIQTYDTESRPTASAIAQANESNIAVKSYLAKHSKDIEDLITSNTYKLVDKEDLPSKAEGLKNAWKIHDKIHGKAQQKTEVTTKHLTVTLDLTGDSTTAPVTDENS